MRWIMFDDDVREPLTSPSISTCSTSTHQKLHSTIRTIKRRHEVETEALLALFNSQNNPTFVRSRERYESVSRIHTPTSTCDLTSSKAQNQLKRMSTTSSMFPFLCSRRWWPVNVLVPVMVWLDRGTLKLTALSRDRTDTI